MLLCVLPCFPLIAMAADDGPPPAATAKIDFARDIAPLLEKRCFMCHGPQQQMSGLRLDQKSAALQGGKSGAVIVAHDSAGSRLIRLVADASPDKKVMPPMVRASPPPKSVFCAPGSIRAWNGPRMRLPQPRLAPPTGPSKRSPVPIRPRCAVMPGPAMPSTISC